jgi:hypothetical protein
MGKNEGFDVGWDEASGPAATAADAEAVAAAAAPTAASDDADTKGGDKATIREGLLPSAATAGPCEGCCATFTDKTFGRLSPLLELASLEMRRACRRLREVELYKRRKPDAEPTTNTLWRELKHTSVMLDCSASSSITALKDNEGSSHNHTAPSQAPANRKPGLQDSAVKGLSHVVMVCIGVPSSRLKMRMRL